MYNKGFWGMLGINILVIVFFAYSSFLNKDTSETTKVAFDSLQEQLILGIDETADIVVQIIAEDKSTYYQEGYSNNNTLIEKESLLKKGSGIIISKKGYIITNNHVVDNIDLKYSVITTDGKSFSVKNIWKDDLIDVAILFVETTNGLQSEASFIDIDTPVNVGQFVFAIGNPLSEYPNTVSLGIISGKGRKINIESLTTDYYAGFYQTDAALSPGNSGGPLISLSGEVLGIVTAISRGGNDIGFVLPLNQKFITNTISLLQQNNVLLRPYIGIAYTDTNTGAKIDSIFSGSPVQGQLLVGDTIIAIDKRKISFTTPLLYYLYMYKPNDTVVFTVLRDNQTMSLPVVLGQKTL